MAEFDRIEATLTVPTLADAQHLIAAANEFPWPDGKEILTADDALWGLLFNPGIYAESDWAETPDDPASFPQTITVGDDDWANPDIEWDKIEGHVTGVVTITNGDRETRHVLTERGHTREDNSHAYFPNDPGSIAEFVDTALNHFTPDEVTQTVGKAVDHAVWRRTVAGELPLRWLTD